MKKIALVTGASSEIGIKISEKLVKTGFIVFAGVINLKQTYYLSQHVEPVILDVTKDDQIKKVYAKLEKKYGKLDLLVNLAGIASGGRLVEFDENIFRTMLDVNVMGAFKMIKMFYPLLKRTKNAKVINVTSLAGIISFPDASAYCASKHALEALGQSVRYELIREGIWVTNLVPGAVNTNKVVKLNYKTLRDKSWFIRQIIPMLSTVEIASAVINIANKEHPPARILLGNDTKLYNFVRFFIPEIIWERLVLMRYREMNRLAV